MAFANNSALVGLIGAFAVDAIWPDLVGGSAAAIGTALIASTGAKIARHDAELAAAGCASSLSEALFRAPDRSGGGPG